MFPFPSQGPSSRTATLGAERTVLVRRLEHKEVGRTPLAYDPSAVLPPSLAGSLGLVAGSVSTRCGALHQVLLGEMIYGPGQGVQGSNIQYL